MGDLSWATVAYHGRHVAYHGRLWPIMGDMWPIMGDSKRCWRRGAASELSRRARAGPRIEAHVLGSHVRPSPSADETGVVRAVTWTDR